MTGITAPQLEALDRIKAFDGIGLFYYGPVWTPLRRLAKRGLVRLVPRKGRPPWVEITEAGERARLRAHAQASPTRFMHSLIAEGMAAQADAVPYEDALTLPSPTLSASQRTPES